MTTPVDGGGGCWATIGVWGRGGPRCPELDRVVHCRNCEVFAGAARGLLEREPPPDHGSDGSVSAFGVRAEEQSVTEPVLVFRIGDEYFALGATWVAEVVEWRAIRTVPHHRGDLLLGIANVGGELRLCVSIEVLFGQARPDVRTPRPTGRLLLLGTRGPEWAAPVDQAFVIHWLPPEDVGPAPATVSQSAQAFLRGMFPWRGRQVGLLDGDLLLGTVARRLA